MSNPVQTSSKPMHLPLPDMQSPVPGFITPEDIAFGLGVPGAINVPREVVSETTITQVARASMAEEVVGSAEAAAPKRRASGIGEVPPEAAVESSKPVAEGEVAAMKSKSAKGIVEPAPAMPKSHALVSGVVTGTGNAVAFNGLDRWNTKRVVDNVRLPLFQSVFSRQAFIGMPLSLVGNAASFGVFFGASPFARSLSQQLFPESDILTLASTGMLCSTAQACATRPLGVMLTRMQLGDKTMAQVAREVPQGQRLSTFYAGLPAMLLRNGVQASIYFPVYECSKQHLRSHLKDHPDAPEGLPFRLVTGAGAGALAGMAGVLGSQPVHNYTMFRAAQTVPLSISDTVRQVWQRGPYATLGYSLGRVGGMYAIGGIATEAVNFMYEVRLKKPATLAPTRDSFSEHLTSHGSGA